MYSFFRIVPFSLSVFLYNIGVHVLIATIVFILSIASNLSFLQFSLKKSKVRKN